MTVKDFQTIAGTIRNLPRENAVRQMAAQAFADNLRVINPRFNERLFMDACGVTQLNIPAHRVRNDDFILGWGEVATFFTIDDERMSFYFKNEDESTDATAALRCNRNDPVRIERLND